MATGMESLLKSIGLGEVLEAANKIAQSGAADKIVAFADLLPRLLKEMGEMNERLERIELQLGGRPGSADDRLIDVTPNVTGRVAGNGHDNGPRTNGVADDDTHSGDTRATVDC